MDEKHARRYPEKTVVVVIGIDPYLIQYHQYSEKHNDYPKIVNADIINYLLYKSERYTFLMLFPIFQNLNLFMRPMFFFFSL